MLTDTLSQDKPTEQDQKLLAQFQIDVLKGLRITPIFHQSVAVLAFLISKIPIRLGRLYA